MQTLTDTDALDHFRKAVSDAEVPCLEPDFETLILRFPSSSRQKRGTVLYERALGATE